jgi:D-tyrosyl-tRNA(Tyr) deacylase
MRALIQRVSRASVTVEGDVRGRIGGGMLVMLGAGHADGPEEIDWLARKLAGLRIFSDGEKLMNRSLIETRGAALVIPQFTLFGDARKGRRPEFSGAAKPEVAAPLFDAFCAALAAEGVPVERGVFRAHMEVELVNDGPVTIWIETPPRGAPA